MVMSICSSIVLDLDHKLKTHLVLNILLHQVINVFPVKKLLMHVK